MKRIIVLVLILIAVTFLPTTAFAKGLAIWDDSENYFAVGVGNGGEADASSISVEIGEISTNKDYNHLVSIGFSLFDLDIPSYRLNYPVPYNSDYTNFGIRQKGELGFFGKYGLEIIKNRRVFVFVLGGFSTFEKIDLARSNATGWYYTQTSSYKSYGMFGVGLSYFLINNKYSIQVEYDNRRGITGGIGFCW